MNWREGFWRIGVILCVPAFILLGIGTFIYIQQVHDRLSTLANDIAEMTRSAAENRVYVAATIVAIATFVWVAAGFRKPHV